eukprot:CAMPEP_0172303020 /NCGR_PEP_ID=MMETSP1058-20130122/4623_1 /TAXON_ID=83371 /ORGANISM="Detonula confervacea, Strain CCMP 353" /LENGTH=1418 /DNA_ID=CAMNT_0013013699 /DNA_START=255 /DNA_END=4511 /DNA_ORIENTATION=-
MISPEETNGSTAASEGCGVAADSAPITNSTSNKPLTKTDAASAGGEKPKPEALDAASNGEEESSLSSLTAISEVCGVAASATPITNGTSENDFPEVDGADPESETTEPTPTPTIFTSKDEEGSGGVKLANDIISDNGRPNDNLQQDGELENNSQTDKMAEKTPPSADQPEGRQLTVIDGPLAEGMLDEGSIAGGPASQATQSGTDDHSQASNISMDSSLGELLGESAAILGNGTIDHNNGSPSGSVHAFLDIVSTEKTDDGHSKPSSDVDMAAAATGEKPPLNHTISSPPNNAASTFQRVRSPRRPMSNRKRVNSSQDIVAGIAIASGEYDDDDDDDDDENDIPPEIQSKIVEKSPAERYIRFKEKLGSGAYKDVFRAYDTIEGIEVAWNVVKLFGVPKAERIRIVNEVRLLERLHHPNIISFHGSWVNRETERVIFVTEILSSGTLKSFVQKVQLIRWKIFKRWAIQILKGLEYLHSQDPPIIHRDLKCDNIFINGTSGDLRIGDFGLSTAISNKNQPLSVLGTPEFMAPELYDESYNEKIDIYAFGMLLLEIITRDVPYHECANPAQIYKKVTKGIPPPSIRRVKSKDARNFILLCLGIGEDANARPSATDLLKHQFLAKKSNDEMAIEVEPAVEDMVIEEKNSMTFSDASDKSSGSRKNELANNKYASSIDGHEIPSRGARSLSPSEFKGGKLIRSESAPALPNSKTKSFESKNASQSKLESMAEDEQADDQFGEMPENEANMKKVTVLMGRGTTLDDDDDPPAKEMEVVSLSSTPPPAAIKASLSRSASEVETSSVGSLPLYKVSAVPIEEVSDNGGGGANSKPYPNNIINLALTLPDEIQTTIEFEFDLVDDDPVQVAREMVMELDEVPDDAVLSISESISGVARQARMTQNQWMKLQQQQQAQQQSVLAQQQALQQHQQAQHQHQQQAGAMMATMHPQGSVTMMQPQGIQAQGTIMMPQQHMYGTGIHGSGFPPPTGSFQNQGGSLVQPPQLGTPGGDQSAQQTQQQPQHNHMPPPPPPSQMSTPQPPSQMSTPQQQHQMHVMQRQSVSLPSSPAPMPPSTAAQQQQQYPSQQPQQQPSMARSNSMEMSSHAPSVGGELNSSQTGALAAATAQGAIQPGAQQQRLPPGMTNSSQDMIVPMQLTLPSMAATQDTSTKALQSQNGHQGALSPPVPQQQHMPLHSQPQMVAPQGSDDDSAADTEEIRKLEQEFEKKMQRAKKSYGTRMDNLHRSKEEAEAQHLITLERYERERIEFEKRVRLGEDEQTRRLNQIQKEFVEQRKEVRQQRAKQLPGGVGAMQQQMQNGNGMDGSIGSRPPLHGGHKRSNSHFDSSSMPSSSQLHPHTSPIISDHKRNSSDMDIPNDALQTLLEPSQQQQIQQQPPRSLPQNLPKARQVTGSTSSTSLRDRSGSTSS